MKKSYHIYKLKEEEALKKAPGLLKLETEPKITRIGLVDYVFDPGSKSFIPFEEIFSYERREK
jgi:hypothetical protein